MKYDCREDIIQLTPKWTGERFADGRPRVPDDILQRIKKNTITEMWRALYVRGYNFQFEGGLKRTNPDMPVMVGRAVTATFLPTRPDLHKYLLEYGHEKENRKGNFNQWAIDILEKDDVLVYDMYGKVKLGCTLGGNLTNVIARKTGGCGGITYGGIRDLEQVTQIKNAQFYYLDTDPTPFRESMLVGINVPCKIGGAVCLPGDVVLGTEGGLLFIPPHLAEICVVDAEKSHVRDEWGFLRVREGKYSAYQVDSPWTLELWEDFAQWFEVAEEAVPYRHLDFSQELSDIRNGIVHASMEPVEDDGPVELATRW